MTSIQTDPLLMGPLPDHTQLPFEDGTFVKNSLEHPQSLVLTDSLKPVLAELYPEGEYFIGQDCGIYWRLTEPREKGAVSPDWYLVPDVPPQLGGQQRRSYVLWQEIIPPIIALEFASGDGSEERDRTPFEGKFWVYETAIRPAFYGIYEAFTGKLEVYLLVGPRYQPVPANARGHYEIGPLHVELGVWQGRLGNQESLWLRWWDLDGNLLPMGWEAEERLRSLLEEFRRQVEQERLAKEEALRQLEQERLAKEAAVRQTEEAQRRAEEGRRHAEEVQRRAEIMAERLRAAGLDPNVP
jgi:Uma2 family endonuclease